MTTEYGAPRSLPILCIPNVSEGKRPDVVEDLGAAIESVSGVRLLDYSSDASHNRSVFTFAGDPGRVQEAVLALFERAIDAIDLRTHRGEHPRLGAVDVVPFVPLGGARMADCVAIARHVGVLIASRFEVPVYLYEEASDNPRRKNLEDIRRGEFEGLARKIAAEGWAPDFGPSKPHRTAGASVVGARWPLIAYNINLATNRLDVAKKVAAAVRQSGGGLPHVKAMGVTLQGRDIVQVSMNLTNYQETSMIDAFQAVRREAARFGVSVLESEIIGLVPAAALTAPASTLRLARFGPEQVLERRIEAVDGGGR
jgi:glutamate formiminotransferase